MGSVRYYPRKIFQFLIHFLHDHLQYLQDICASCLLFQQREPEALQRL